MAVPEARQPTMSKLIFDQRALGKQASKRSQWVLKVPEDVLSKGKNVMSLPEELLSAREMEITNSSANELLQHLHTLQPTDRWTSEEVTHAFIKRACIADQATNCLTEVLFDQALLRAKELDAHLERTSTPAGPLAGLPISVKDCFNIEGLDSTLGFVAWIDKPATYESLLVKILREAGAVLYCKTNIPTAMMIAESVNNVWGRTANPFNTDFTSGGSSGGEGALIALRGSPLGVGTDIGGSIRIPAALCGLYSLKPSFGRFPTMNSKSGMAGQEAVNSINGPMANDLQALTIFAKAIVGSEPWRWDPKCVPLPWKKNASDDLPTKGLAFGIILNDGCVHPSPPVTRALQLTRKRLEEAGHTVIEWQVQNDEFREGSDLLQTFFTMDGRTGIYDIMQAGGEDERGVPGLGPLVESKGIHDNWAAQAARWAWAAQICSKWESLKDPNGRVIDAVISPVTPHAGAEHDKFGRHVGYTGVWNLMDFPGVTLPIITADKIQDEKRQTTIPSSFFNEDDETVWRNYDSTKVDGLPVSLQLVGRRLEEEKLLAVAGVVDSLVKRT